MVIFWEIRKATSAVIFGRSRVYVKRIIFQILFHFKCTLSKVIVGQEWTCIWNDICQQVVNEVPRIVCIAVKWEKPA